MLKIDSEAAPKALNDLGHLASAVGHNVINAFSAIVSNAELLRLKLGPDAPPIDKTQIANMIIDTALEASTVARRLIDFTRPVTSIGTDKVALDRLVTDFIEARRSTDAEGIRWSSRIDPVPLIYGDSGQLEVMLDLLVANAREAANPGEPTSIHLTTLVDSRGWVTLEIRDFGQGLSLEAQERSVEPFYTTRNGHLGVGLSIANGIWRRHRGTLSIRSHPEGGVILRLCVEPAGD